MMWLHEIDYCLGTTAAFPDVVLCLSTKKLNDMVDAFRPPVSEAIQFVVTVPIRALMGWWPREARWPWPDDYTLLERPFRPWVNEIKPVPRSMTSNIYVAMSEFRLGRQIAVPFERDYIRVMWGGEPSGRREEYVKVIHLPGNLNELEFLYSPPLRNRVS